MFSIERIGVRFILGETRSGTRMTALARREDVGLRKMRRGIGWRKDIVMPMAIVTGSDVRGDARFAQCHGFAVIGFAVMFEPVLMAFAAALVTRHFEVA